MLSPKSPRNSKRRSKSPGKFKALLQSKLGVNKDKEYDAKSVATEDDDGTRKQKSTGSMLLTGDESCDEPTTPTVRKIRVRDKRLSDRKLNDKKLNKSGHGTDGSKTPVELSPKTPRAKEKIRRSTLTDRLENDRSARDALSIPDTHVAVSAPSPKQKKKRRNSLGAMDTTKKREEVRERKKLGKRSTSVGRLNERKKKISENKNSPGSLNRDKMMLLLDGTVVGPGEANEVEKSPRSKSRTTVDGRGKIRRISSKKSLIVDSDSEGEQSRKSTSSRRSKSSVKSSGSKKSSKNGRKSSRDADAEADRRKKRPGGRRKGEEKKKSNDEDCDKSDHSRGSRHKRKSGEKVSQERKKELISDDSFDSLNISERDLKLGTFVEINTANADLEDEIVNLQDKVVHLKEEQFNSQTDATILRKELRDRKLDFQKSQTELRELQMKVRERDQTIENSEIKIAALEKAIESQLDRIEDLEDELKRADEDIFALEDKLCRMHEALAEAEAGTGATDGTRRSEDLKTIHQLERRLRDLEKELSERDRQLQNEKNKGFTDGDSIAGSDAFQLEQDNKMLLKALNRQKARFEKLRKEKEEEVEDLKKKQGIDADRAVVRSKTMSENELARENERLNEEICSEQLKFAIALEKKDDAIAFMELEMERLKAKLEAQELGESSKMKREMEASKAEAQAMKSQYEGAQERNRILEDDIHHWKSVNIHLEEEIAELKSQANSWRMRYENVVEDDGTGGSVHRNDDNSMLHFNSDGRTAAEISMHSRYDSDGEESSTKGAISNLWSKLTTPTGKRPTLGSFGDTLGGSTRSLKEHMQRSTFH